MKRLFLSLMCLTAMMLAGTSLKAQEVTVVLIPGYNWIGIPCTDTLDFATALGSFTPTEGDVIKSQWSNAVYRNGHWVGQVSQFHPGYGYMYKSNRTMPVMLTFNAQQPAPQVVVTTMEPTDLTSNSATSGGSITTDAYVFAKGICWATHADPTPMDDDHSENGGGDESFTAEMTELDQNTTYYVRAYAVTQNGIVYGNEVSFNTIVEYEYVDLGLPSGLLWATCNLGAETPEDYGDYFAWGETQPKDNFSWTNYQYCMGSFNTLTKYCNNPDIGYNGFTDDLTTLLPEDDAATANWGDEWRMPTEEEWQELYQNTTVTWTMRNGVRGRLFTAENGNSIFMPAAGYCNESLPEAAGIIGDYWTSSLDTDYPSGALSFFFNSSNYYISFCNRLYGRNVRAVRSGSQNNVPTGAINGKFTINADGDQVYFSQGNLQYQASTNIWKFAENQYDYIGSTNSNISSTYSGWIDLFGWGTSGWNNGNTYYQPWSSAGYEESNHGQLYGPPGQYNLTGSYANADWGVYNPISNGGNQTNQWRTLTQPEWNYVFNTRSTTSGIRYAKANVNNVNGVILLPDDWSTNTYSLSNTNSSGASFSSNTITASQWSTLEQAGAVFLPAAGYRYGTSVSDVGSSGYCWSASCSNSYDASNVYFGDSFLNADDWNLRYYGQSVRLVAPAEN